MYKYFLNGSEIEKTQVDLLKLQNKIKMKYNGNIVELELLSDEEIKANETMRTEAENKSRRGLYLDAYRKYQAAVNYGEFQRDAIIDGFIAALRDKDWTALDNIPPQIKYFTGEIGFSESGLVKSIEI